jgi:hypothetical protein
MRAALTYQRATSDADRVIADRLSALVDERRSKRESDDDPGDDGAAGVLAPVS